MSQQSRVASSGRLKRILTGEYCGVALGYRDGEFIIYSWTDSPVSSTILAHGRTMGAALDDYDRSYPQLKTT